VELRHLRYFHAVAKELHYGRAAARLHVEPQPLNFQVKQLERELGFALLGRRENKTYLTPAGAAFLAETEEILAATDRAVARASSVARGEAGVLRVGYASPLARNVVVPAVKALSNDNRDVSFDLLELSTGEQEHALNRHELDVALSFFPVPDGSFASQTLVRAPLVVVVPTTDPVAHQPSADWRDLDGRATISVEHRFPAFQQRMDAVLREHGVTTIVAHHVGDFESALEMVAAGLGVLILPSLLRNTRDDLTFVALPVDGMEAVLAAIWRVDDNNPLRDRFVETLVAVAGT
jgi:DNA-binding transcriptional LysR family regulator